jgi:hypothetical protein
MDVLIERCAGLDVHKDTVMACVRFPGERGQRHQPIHEFGTTTAELLALRDFLSAHGVTVSAWSTGVYWKPVSYVLEDAITCHLLNARHLKNVPGRRNRRQRRRVDRPTRGARAGPPVVRTPEGRPRAPQADPVPPGPDRGADP